MKVLLDTNALSALWNGDERVLDALGGAECVFMSIIVLGELFAGFRGGTRMKENRARLAEFLAKPTVRPLELSTETALVKNSPPASARQTTADSRPGSGVVVIAV